MEHVMSGALAAVVIAVAFMVIFQRNIRGFLDRTRSIKLPGGFHAESSEVQQQQLAPPEAAAGALASEQLGSPMRDPLLDPIEAEARQQITASVPDPKFHLDWALRLFATALVQRDNEFCYRLIFGSQIRALKAAVQNAGSIADDRLKTLYDQASFNFPEQYDGFDFDNWRSFFSAQKLATIEQDGSMKLLPKALAFLQWLAVSGAAEDKLL